MQRRQILILMSAVLSCCAAVSSAQAPTVRVGTPTLVASTTEHEPHLAVDPSTPSHFVAAAIVSTSDTGSFDARMARQTCSAFTSYDGGVTWSRHDFSTTWCFDPWVVIMPDGAVVVSMVGMHSSLPQQGRAGLLVFRSADGGRTWDDHPVGLGRSHDHPTMSLDWHSATKQGWLYVVSHRPTRTGDGQQRYGVWSARSRDGGKTFDDPVYVVVNNLHNLPEMSAVLRDGTFVVAYVDAAFLADSGGTNRSLAYFERRRAWVMRSADGGASFSTPLFVTDACGPPPDYRLSAFAADASTSAFAGQLYFACRRAGGGPIVVATSRDRGDTWKPVIAMRATGSDSTAESRIPGLALNDRGVVGVAWIEATKRPDKSCEQRVYFAASSDGGRAFSDGTEVSRSTDCGTGGDYFGLVAVPDGSFRLMWAAATGNRSRLRVVRIEVE
jgi:hypothetical protein